MFSATSNAGVQRQRLRRAKAARLLARPGYHDDSRKNCPGHNAGNGIAGGMTERGAGAVRCNDLLGGQITLLKRVNLCPHIPLYFLASFI